MSKQNVELDLMNIIKEDKKLAKENLDKRVKENRVRPLDIIMDVFGISEMSAQYKYGSCSVGDFETMNQYLTEEQIEYRKQVIR